MSESNSRSRSVSTLTLVVVLIATATAACNDTSEPNDNGPWPPLAETPLTPTPTATAPTPPEPQLPDHNYDEREGWTYYYIAAVSEEDQKRGRAVGNVSAFQYLGRNADGEHIIASLHPNGAVSYRAKCATECRIIDTDYGEKIAYSPRSLIGAAFQDAFRGKLRIAQWEKDDVVSASPARTVASADLPDRSSPTEGGTNEQQAAPQPVSPQPTPDVPSISIADGPPE